MDTFAYSQEVIKIQRKIFQALNIWKELELKKEKYLISLRNCVENDAMSVYLAKVKDAYDKELRVLRYCKAGLEHAKETLEQASGEVLKPKNIPKVIGQYLLRKVGKLFMNINKKKFEREISTIRFPEGTASIQPLTPDVDEDVEFIIEIARLLYPELVKEIVNAESNIELINDALTKQERYISELISLGKKGVLVGNIAWYDQYTKFERERFNEREVVIGIGKKSKRAKIITKINNINLILKKNKKLAAIQPILIPPTSSAVSVPTALYASSVFGPLIFFSVIACFTLLRWSPTITVIMREWKHI